MRGKKRDWIVCLFLEVRDVLVKRRKKGLNQLHYLLLGGEKKPGHSCLGKGKKYFSSAPTIHHGGKAWQQAFEAAGHFESHSQEAEKDQGWCSASFLLFRHPRAPVQAWYCPS